MKRRFSITARLIVLMSLLFVAVIGAMSTVIYLNFRNSLDKQLELRTETTQQQVHESIRAWLLPKFAAIKAHAQVAAVAYPDLEGLRPA